MPKVWCDCDEVINISPYPNEHGFNFIPESVLENALESLGEAFEELDSKQEFARQASKILSHILSPGIMQAYECPKCGRLLVFGTSWDDEIALTFQLEKAHDPDNAHSLCSLANSIIKAKQAKS